MNEISIARFVQLLKITFPLVFPATKENLLHYGHIRGWLEDQDERFCNNVLTRQTAARILHLFMKVELGLPDLKDISAANILADLYTCHTCVNHIAQIFLRGIIKAEILERDGKEYTIFNQLAALSEEEASIAIKQLEKITKGKFPAIPQ